MKVIRFAIVTTVALLMGVAPRFAHAEARLYFDTSSSTPSLSNPIVDVNQGESVTLYLWATDITDPAQRFNGLSLDINSSQPYLTRTSFSYENPEIFGADRWDSVGTGGAFTSSLLVDNANAVNTSLSGSNMGVFGPAGFDPTYHLGTDSYRIGQITLTADAVGTTELRLGVGQQGIALTASSNPNVFFGFGAEDALAGNAFGATSLLADATINVVPEPSGVVLSGIAVAGMVTFVRRQRRRTIAHLE